MFFFKPKNKLVWHCCQKEAIDISVWPVSFFSNLKKYKTKAIFERFLLSLDGGVDKARIKATKHEKVTYLALGQGVNAVKKSGRL